MQVKRRRLILTGLSVLLSLLTIIACNNYTVNNAKPLADEIFSENPVNISWNGSKDEGVNSFQADIEVFSMNSRTDEYVSLQNKYRMSQKTINGVPHIRLDFAPEFNGGMYRSVVSNDTEIVLFDTNSGTVEYRIPIEEDASAKDLAFFTGETALSRINLSLIKSEAKRLAFDVIDTQETALSINLPSHLFQNEYETRISTRITFDAINETLSEVETVTILEDGSTVTTGIYPMYEESNGEPIKIGSVTFIDTQVPTLIEGFAPDIPIYESSDDIPEISSAEAEQLAMEGNLHEVPSVTFGNPADLSSLETIIEVYSDIEINSVDDASFRLLGGM